MRRVFAVVLALVATLGLLAAPVFAQAPAPKVTITGLLDFVANAYNNWPQLDVTDGGKDNGWYSRERGVFTLTGEVGKTKAVWALELDFTNGAGAGVTTTTFSGTTANMDLDTDVAGAVETKWLYVETPFTGPGSMMPFIPVASMVRAGAQPSRGHEYKNGILLGGDMPGIAVETTWAPNVRSTLTFAQIGEALDKITAAAQTEDYAILFSVEWDVFKGLTIKPTYAFASYDGGNSGTSNLGTEAKNGFSTNSAVGAGGTLSTTRHTFGGDVRWTTGGFTLQPTFLVQLGDQQISPNRSVDIESWIFDVTAGYRVGPLNIEGRLMWTPGMDSKDSVAAGKDIEYYQSINPAFGYMAGWTEIQTSGVDYATALLAGAPGVSLRQSPSYDKYGRIFVALAADYALTPALTLKSVVNFSWTDESVDTSGVLGATGITSPRIRGSRDEENYLGTELNLGMTYRFAPNVALDLMGAYMWTGEAMNHARTGTCTSTASCVIYDADDVVKGVARVRFTF